MSYREMRDVIIIICFFLINGGRGGVEGGLWDIVNQGSDIG
jgi:hypothetical protein